MSDLQKTQKAKVLFLVFSGKASAIFDDTLLKNKFPNVKLIAIEGQWDNGGNTGYLIDFYEEELTEFERKSGQITLKEFLRCKNVLGDKFIMPPPMGDLKSQIARWVRELWRPSEGTTNIKEIERIKYLIAARVSRPEECLDNLSELMTLISKNTNDPVANKLKDDNLMNLLSPFKDHFRQFSIKHPSEDNYSVGNIFLSFLYCVSYKIYKDEIISGYADHFEVFFDFLKKLNMVPDSVRLEFMISGRYKLSATSVKGNKIEGEKNFDKYLRDSDDPIDPSPYTISEDGETSTLTRKEEELFDSNLIVMPPGSLSNWMPLLRKFGHIIKERNIPIIWVVNAFTHESEVNLRTQIKYINSLGLNPIILAPIGNAFDGLDFEDKEIQEQSYAQERKHEVDFDTELSGLQNQIFKILQYTNEEKTGGGIKYDSLELNKIFTRLFNKITLENTEVTRELLLEELHLLSEEFTVH